MKEKKSIAIIGSGPSALMLAAILNKNLFDIVVYEKKPTPARKFLVAGDGGFNLTHSEDIRSFISRYTPSAFFEKIISSFGNEDLIKWLQSIGIKTYTGSSKRIFPLKGIKPIEVLNAILRTLDKKNVVLNLQYEWKGWSKNNELIFTTTEGQKYIKPDIVVFALGGASWSITGSDGVWGELFLNKNVNVLPFEASNCAVGVLWPGTFIKNFEGRALKNISVDCDGVAKKGELMITKFGLEGGAIYALGSLVRKQLKEKNKAEVWIDFKPSLSRENIIKKLSGGKHKTSLTGMLKKEIKLDEIKIALLKNFLNKTEFTNTEILAERIKKFPVVITQTALIDEAISTVGGISLDEIDQHFQLKKMPGNYVIGEMLDWDAPTGGYLLQACFSMGYVLGTDLNEQHSK